MGCGRTWTAAALLCLAAISPSQIAGQTPQTPPEVPTPPIPPIVVEVPAVPAEIPPAGAPTRERRYRSIPLTGGDKELRGLFTPEQLAVLEKLNRRDIPHLARAKTLIVPEEWLPDELLYSPLPLSWSLTSGTPVLILETYDFAASPPWLSLDWLAAGIELPLEPPKS